MFCNIRISAIVLIVMVDEMNAGLVNVALSKETIQSSQMESGGNPFLAVDGNINQYWDGGSCTHTQEEDNQPYWEVDLGSSYVIAFIKVYNRVGCCSERLSSVEVTVSTDHVTYARYGYHPGAIGSTYEFYPENPVVVGRWVKITLLEIISGALTLCEVEIMSNMTYRRGYLRTIQNIEGTSAVIASIPVKSTFQCAALCFQEDTCHSVNIRQEMMSSIQMQCQLLNDVSYRTTINKNVTYWTFATDL